MKPTYLTPLLLASLTILGLSLGSANAATVFVNSSANTPGPGASVAGFKLRASPTNWDLALSNQGGTPTAADFVAANTANSFTGGGYTVQFTIENRPGQGFVLTTVRTQGSGTTLTRIAWGTFSPAVIATTQAASLNGVVPGTAFDTLTLDAQSLLGGSSLRVRDLVFTAPGLTVTGDLNDADLAANGTTANSQYIVADTNLAAVPWTLTGEVRLRRNNGGGNDEQVRFVVTAKQGALLANPIPEPGVALLSAAALAGLCLRRRRA